MTGQGICGPCGRPDGTTCKPCLDGTPPAEKLAELRAVAARDLAGRIREALAELSGEFALLASVLLPGSVPPDPDAPNVSPVASRRSVLRFEVLGLLDVRGKDADPARADRDRDRLAWTWLDGRGRLVQEDPSWRTGVVPTLASWARLVEAESLEAGVLVPEFGAESCSSQCAEVLVRALSDGREGPCSEDARTHDVEVTCGYVCDWLTARVSWVAAQPWAAELADECERLLADVRRATGWQPLERLTCQQCGWSVVERDGGAWFVCTGCRRAWTRMEAHRMAERMQPRTLREVAVMLEVSERMLGELKAEGAVVPVGKRGAAHLFDVTAVQAAVLRRRAADLRRKRVGAVS